MMVRMVGRRAARAWGFELDDTDPGDDLDFSSKAADPR
jgi:hypothetical protein